MDQIGAFRIVRELARGGMGVVYLAQGPSGEQVAIKRMLADGLTDPDQVERFRREAETLEALRHPGILRVHTHGVVGGQPYMVMDLLAGPTLAEAIKQEGPLPEKRLVTLGQRMAEALACAHAQGVVHRDLKPENVILRGPDDPVLVDFGLVRLLNLEHTRLTVSGLILGSPNYMAPEQAQGDSTVGPAADVYGLGATLYHAATGRPPFAGQGLIAILEQVLSATPTPPRALRPELPPALEAVILRCLEKAPGARHAGAIELADALGWVAGPTRRKADGRGRFIVAGSLTALLALGAGWALLPERDDPSHLLEATQGDLEAAKRYLEEGLTLARAGRCAEAVLVLDRALELDPTLARGYAARGTSQLILLQNGAAEDDLTRALELGLRTSSVYSNRAVVRIGAGRVREALEDLNTALSLDPAYAGALFHRGSCLLKLRQPERAVADFDRALTIDADLSSSVLPLRAKAKRAAGLPQQALEDYEDYLAQAANPSPELRIDYAATLLALKRYATTIEVLDVVLGEVEQADAYLLRGEALLRLKRLAAALEDSDRALALDPERAGAFRIRASARWQRGEPDLALHALNEALRLDPRNATAWAFRAEIHNKTGDFARALEDCERALAVDPEYGPVYLNRGDAHANLKRFAEALEDYARWRALYPNDARGYLGCGEMKRTLGDPEGALAEIEQAIQLDPQNPQCWIRRTLVNLDLERWEQANSDVSRAIELGLDRWDERYARGIALYELGRDEAALAEFDEALRRSPPPDTAARIEQHRAQVLSRLGR